MSCSTDRPSRDSLAQINNLDVFVVVGSLPAQQPVSPEVTKSITHLQGNRGSVSPLDQPFVSSASVILGSAGHLICLVQQLNAAFEVVFADRLGSHLNRQGPPPFLWRRGQAPDSGAALRPAHTCVAARGPPQ